MCYNVITKEEPKAIRVEINVGNNCLSYERIDFKTAEECTKEWERINAILTKTKEK